MALTPERLKSYATKFGLGDDATEDQVLEAMDALEITDAEEEPAIDEPSTGESPELIAAKEALAEAKKLSESNPAIAAVVKLMEVQATQLEAQNKKLMDTETALKLTEVDNTVKRLNELANKSGFTIPIPVRDEVQKALLGMNNKQLSETYVSGIESILNAKLIALGEKGKLRIVGNGNDDDKTALSEINAAVKKLTDADPKITFSDGLNQVALMDPDLYNRYRSESYAGGE